MKKYLYPAILIAVTTALGSANAQEEELLDRVAAIVNGQVITLYEVIAVSEPLLDSLPLGTDRSAARMEAMQAGLHHLIDERLLDQEIRSRNIIIGEADIDRAISDVRRQHGMTESDFRQAISGQGYTWESYRKDLASQLERYRLLGAEVQSRIEIREEDVQSYLARIGSGGRIQEARVRHILLAAEESQSGEDTVPGGALELISRIEAGEDFEELARTNSIDSSANNGGNLGWLRKGRMIPALEEAIFSASEGDVIGPVRSPSGYHIIEILERRQRRPQQDESAEQRAREALYEESLERETRRFLEGLRRQAIIEIRISELS